METNFFSPFRLDLHADLDEKNLLKRKSGGYLSSGGKNLIKNPGGGAEERAVKSGDPIRRRFFRRGARIREREYSKDRKEAGCDVPAWPWTCYGNGSRIRLSASFFTDKNHVIVYDDRSCNVFARPGNRIEKSAGA